MAEYKCYSAGARKFEDELNDLDIKYSEFKELSRLFSELTDAEKAEVSDLLKD